MPQAILYTSIPPTLDRRSCGEAYGDAYQRECIRSWRAAGFGVVSLNSDDEIESLKPRGYDVEFSSTGPTGGRPSIAQFFAAIQAAGAPVAGIINADCYWMSLGPAAVTGRLINEAAGAMVLLERLNLDPQTMRPTGFPCVGFDAFLFDTRRLHEVNHAARWAIGKPQWDYWFPVAMYLAGAPLKRLDTPVIVHLEHDQRWDDNENLANAQALLDCFDTPDWRTVLPAPVVADLAAAGASARLSDAGVESARAAWAFGAWLRALPLSVVMRNAEAPGNFECRLLAGLAGSNEMRLDHQLSTVTLPYWINAKRRSAGRLLDRAIKQLRPSRSDNGAPPYRAAASNPTIGK